MTISTNLDKITINGTDYIRVDAVKSRDDDRDVMESLKHDIDYFIYSAKKIQDDYAKQGLTHNALENEGYLRGLLKAKSSVDYHCDTVSTAEPDVVQVYREQNQCSAAHVVYEYINGYAILQRDDGWFWIGERDFYLTHQTGEPPFIWVDGNYPTMQAAYQAFVKFQQM